MANTFGSSFANALADGRQAVIPRQKRFKLIAEAGKGTTIHGGTEMGVLGFSQGGGGDPGLKVTLKFARADTLTFGVSPGRAVVGNSIQGTAEGLDDQTV